MPSSFASTCAPCKGIVVGYLDTFGDLSANPCNLSSERFLGDKQRPVPWILCGPCFNGCPASVFERSLGESFGSTAIAWNESFCALDPLHNTGDRSTCPTSATMMSTFRRYHPRISSAVFCDDLRIGDFQTACLNPEIGGFFGQTVQPWRWRFSCPRFRVLDHQLGSSIAKSSRLSSDKKSVPHGVRISGTFGGG